MHAPLPYAGTPLDTIGGMLPVPGQPSPFDHDDITSCVDDAMLVAGLRRHDTSSVEYVLQQYAPAIYRFAYYQLQDAALAEDVVSEVLVRMIGRVDSFRLGEGTFQSWLFRVARNLIADHYRARKRRPQISLEEWLEADPANEPGLYDSRLELLLDREQIEEGLASLTDEQREVIVLHVIEGCELPQVAELLDRSVASIKGLYYRGIRSLQRALLRHGGDDDSGQICYEKGSIFEMGPMTDD